jgi:hypothetical protein
MTIFGAFVLPLVMVGMIDASATRQIGGSVFHAKSSQKTARSRKDPVAHPC